MFATILLLVIFLIETIQTQDTDLSIVHRYFTEVHSVTHVTLFSLNFVLFPSLIKKFTRDNIFVQQITDEPDNYGDVFHARNFPVGAFVDRKSFNGGRNLLVWASQNEYFNSSYFWLINGHDNETANNVLGNVFHIHLDSQITFIEKIDEQCWGLIDVYSYGRHLHYELVMTSYGKWCNKEMVIVKKFPLMYRKNYRGDFKGLVMRQTVVVRFCIV